MDNLPADIKLIFLHAAAVDGLPSLLALREAGRSFFHTYRTNSYSILSSILKSKTSPASYTNARILGSLPTVKMSVSKEQFINAATASKSTQPTREVLIHAIRRFGFIKRFANYPNYPWIAAEEIRLQLAFLTAFGLLMGCPDNEWIRTILPERKGPGQSPYQTRRASCAYRQKKRNEFVLSDFFRMSGPRDIVLTHWFISVSMEDMDKSYRDLETPNGTFKISTRLKHDADARADAIYHLYCGSIDWIFLTEITNLGKTNNTKKAVALFR